MSAMAVNVPDTFIDNAKVMSKGQVTMVNSAVYAMQMIQSEMTGEGEKVGLTSEEDVNTAVKEIRSEGE